jgi:diketogulonate reductase-like aldo/keto reductase
MTTVPTVTLRNGVHIPQLGYGVFQVPPEDAQRAVESALEVGYRHIDTAAAYNNEAGVGAGIAASGLARNDVFVTTKLRNGNQGFDSAKRALADSLGRLRLDYVDLYLIHWPSPARDQYVPSWRAMEEMNGDGLARAIGVSNFLPHHLERLLAETDVPPAVNQIELHPSYQQVQLAQFSRSHGIAVEAYSPLGQGSALAEPVIVELAQKYAVTPAQVILRWHLQNGNIVIPKSANPSRMSENFDVFGFELAADDLSAISALERGDRIGSDPDLFEITQIR